MDQEIEDKQDGNGLSTCEAPEKKTESQQLRSKVTQVYKTF